MISSLILRNFGPFRREYRLDLAPTIYAVVARREDDPDASNMSGKSWLLSAIRFALFGSHLADREDGWITRGEREGSVALTLADGLAVERSREFGKSTQLAVGDARGKDAQQLIERRIGLGEPDFLAASFFAQKAMSRFVVANPSSRSAEVSAWLRLAPLQRAHKRAVALASEVERAEQLAAAREESVRQRLVELSRPSPLAPCRSGMECGIAGCSSCSKNPDVLRYCQNVVEVADGRANMAANDARRAEEELSRARSLLTAAEGIRHREQVRAEVANLEARADEEPDLGPLRARAEDEGHSVRNAQREVHAARSLVAGRFSGSCPVNGRACPVADEINEDRVRAERILVDAEDVARLATITAITARADLERAQEALDTIRARQTRLQALREQLARLDASAPPQRPGAAIPDAGEVARLEARVRALQDVERQAVLDLDRARRVADDVASLATELERVAGERRELSARLRTRREAVAILGRSGVQRRVAEGALREVEAGACSLLAEAGIDLSVALRWDHPTDQLATACEACDAPYPPSRRVRACHRCGAPRGPKLAEGLEVELSRVSGFAEDAAGIALSLAAGAWLRRERDVQWPVLCADEAWAAADVKNRRALLNLFKAAARQCGLRQMFLVAHSDALMDTLPGRIEVVAGPNGSRVSVVG